nr:hypothetical protein [Tanacetum cinerariifolium]
MASSSCGVFEANPLKYDFDMVSKLDNVDIHAMDYSEFITFLETTSHAISNALYFLVPGLDLKGGLRSLKNDVGMRSLREYALRNDGEIDVYMAHSEFDFDDRIIDDIQHSGSDEDDYDIYDIDPAQRMKTPLVLPWEQIPRLDSGVRIRIWHEE